MNTDHALSVQEQMLREQSSVDRGLERYIRAVAKAEAGDTLPGNEIVRANVGPLAAHIADQIKAYADGKAAANAKKMLALLGGADATAIAFITLRAGISAAFRDQPLTGAAVALGGLVEEHIGFSAFHKAEKGLAEWWETRMKETPNVDQRRKIVRGVLRGHDVDRGWAKSDQLAVGSWLLGMLYAEGGDDAMAEGSTRLLQLDTRFRGVTSTYYLMPSQELLDTIERGHNIYALVRPFTLPMTTTPLDWTDPLSGGYITKQYPLVISANSNAITDLWSARLDDVYDALNAIQKTRWQINKPVLSALQAVIQSPAGGPGMPAPSSELPPRPAHIPREIPFKDLSDAQKEEIKAWRAKAKHVHADNATRGSQTLALRQQLGVATEFADIRAFYFPHRIDSRGRIYPMSTALHPQANDIGKALLRFADGKRLGPDGAGWLAVHTANCYGVDKVVFEDRLQWVMDNEAMILEVALSPLDTVPVWAQADSPYQFLAACFEWAGYVLSGRSEDYVSHLPIGMDGSCSGLQHFSAALRDEVGGRAVNLVPTGKVEDLYTEVASRVNLCLDDPACATDLLVWRGLVTRKVVKQPCMTYAYSATVSGMRDQIFKVMQDLPQPDGGAGLYGHCAKLAVLVRQCIEDVVIAAAGAMKWMQEASALAADKGLDVRWMSASGLPVVQRVTRPEIKRPFAWFAGVRIRVRLSEDSNVIDKMGQRNAIAPNWVHSQDAAHLVAVVNGCVANGLSHFAMIHDSFGVHAADVGILNAVTRETFVAQYTPDRLAQLKGELEAHLKVTLPALPVAGSLDLSGVLNSDYFFA